MLAYVRTPIIYQQPSNLISDNHLNMNIQGNFFIKKYLLKGEKKYEGL